MIGQDLVVTELQQRITNHAKCFKSSLSQRCSADQSLSPPLGLQHLNCRKQVSVKSEGACRLFYIIALSQSARTRLQSRKIISFALQWLLNESRCTRVDLCQYYCDTLIEREDRDL